MGLICFGVLYHGELDGSHDVSLGHVTPVPCLLVSVTFVANVSLFFMHQGLRLINT